MKKVVVIGGGASGMIAAGKCAEMGNEVVLLEKNERLGKKLMITGKGRCNLTNASPVSDLMSNICANPKFLYSAIHSFTAEDTIDFFNFLGLKTKIERGNRVFPESDKASDVVNALERYMKKAGVTVMLSNPAVRIESAEGRVKGVLAKSGFIIADAVIAATGGLSYPTTGSTGDGFKFARELGHRVTKLYPSLVPLNVVEAWPTELQGLSLKNIALTVKVSGKAVYSDFGELMFTHFGVSGPVILSASRYLLGKHDKNCVLELDLKPALDEVQLDKRLLRDFEKFSHKAFKNSLSELLPSKMIAVIVRLSEIAPDKKCCEITRAERKGLAALLKHLFVTVKDVRGFNEAVITAGGIDVGEVNPKTMESRLVKGLYFCGELLDVDAYTGGFNLQIAFSTGNAAGKVM